ncbi:P43 5S RNA-binding protein-like [Neosynchiropus ocellatus]
MNGVPRGKRAAVRCATCGASFSRAWKLKEHEAAHAGQSPVPCPVSGCGRRFTRSSHLRRHALQHTGGKRFRCQTAGCAAAFSNAGRLKRHVGMTHRDKTKYFKCPQPKCSLTFKKRRLLKLHQQDHGVTPKFKCTKDGCHSVFASHVARRAHEKKHAGYRCHVADCSFVEHSWSKLHRHVAQHTVPYVCKTCKKEFKKESALRRHRRAHASHKPVLVCPREGCQAYFSTTFNLQHHIRKVHLELLKYRCSFPDCPREFAMRESVTRHLLHHDPSSGPLKKRMRSKKAWHKRLDGHQLPLVEGNLHRLFALRMRISRRAKVETSLSGLFNERKIPHYVDPEVDLRLLFTRKSQGSSEGRLATPVLTS